MDKRLKKTILFILFIFLLFECDKKEGNYMDDRKIVEKYLNITLSASISDLKYFLWKPSDHLDYFKLFVKIATTEEEYANLIKKTNMKYIKPDKGAIVYLPPNWTAPENNNMPWWNPREDKTEIAAANEYGINGSIAAKYEDGNIFLIITDTGHREGD